MRNLVNAGYQRVLQKLDLIVANKSVGKAIGIVGDRQRRHYCRWEHPFRKLSVWSGSDLGPLTLPNELNSVAKRRLSSGRALYLSSCCDIPECLGNNCDGLRNSGTLH